MRRPAAPPLDGVALDGGDGRGDADQDLGPVEPADPDPVQEHAEHPLGDLEVCDGASAQRPFGPMYPGVRPIICHASVPMASTSRCAES